MWAPVRHQVPTAGPWEGDVVIMSVLADELRCQMREARTRLSWARNCDDQYLVDVLSARLEELSQIAQRHGIQLAA